ncbi:MAG TPA: methyl-accepting chemotaxis protein [Thermotogota bacterium]|nr:methyl-accepting chemotaxis protein [Thermotogota bacterium]
MAKFEVKSIKTKLLLYFIPVTVLVLVVSALIIGIMARTSTTDLTENLTQEITNASNMSVEEWLVGLNKELSNLAITNVVKSMNYEQYGKRLQDVLGQNRGLYESAFVTFPDGKSYDQNGTVVDLSHREYFDRIIRKGEDFAISNALVSNFTGNPIFVVATAIKEDNKTIGMLAITVTLDVLAKKLNSIKIGKEGYLFLADGTGLTISHPDRKMIMSLDMTNTKKDGFIGLEEAGIRMTKGESGIATYKRPDGTAFHLFFQPVANTPNWSLGAAVPEAQINETSNRILMVIIIAFLVIIAVIVVIAIFVGIVFSNPVKELAKTVLRIADYDLTYDKDSKAVKYMKQKDEIGQMTTSLATMQKNLVNLIKKVDEEAKSMSVASTNLASVSEEQSASAEELESQAQSVESNVQNTSASIEEVTSGVEEVAASSQEVSKNSQELATDIENTEKAVKAGQKELEIQRQKMEQVDQQNDNTQEIVTTVAKKANNVQEIVNTIASISQQTNLLALNAAIEAARAGDAGKGFAVVADEIRKLAEESQSASANIAKILNEIDDGSDQANEAVKKTVLLYKELRESNKNVVEQFDQITTYMETVNNRVEALMGAAEEQSASAEEMASAMDTSAKSTSQISEEVEQMSGAIAQQSTGAQQVTESAEELSRLADELEKEIGKFKY